MLYQNYLANHLERFLGIMVLGITSCLLFTAGLSVNRLGSALLLMSCICLFAGAVSVGRLMQGKRNLFWIQAIYWVGFPFSIYIAAMFSIRVSAGWLIVVIWSVACSVFLTWILSCAIFDCQHMVKDRISTGD